VTISPPDARLGARPRLESRPSETLSSSGQEAAELAASAGLILDPWQQHVLDVALSERADGSWSAFEVGLIVPRQNGKGSILEARELAGLFLFGERLILHSAHEFKTAAEAFLRIKSLVDNTDDLRKKVKQIRTSHGDEGIELLNGARLRFVARSRGSGRGFSGDCVILDEAYNLGPQEMGALLPTLSARPNPQIWYTSSAPMSTSEQLHAVRRRALAGGSPRLAFLEWSIDPAVDKPDDPASWAKANPSFGIRIPEEFVRSEIDAMPAAEFARERLGVPDEELGRVQPVISADAWAACLDAKSQPIGPLVLAVDMPPERTHVVFVVGGRRDDGLTHVEVIARRSGTKWVQAELARLLRRHEIRHVLVVPGGPAGGVLPDLEAACDDAKPGVQDLLRLVSAQEFTQACGRLFDLTVAEEPAVRHIGQDVLDVAVMAGQKKASGDAWRWARQSTDVDISPLCAVSVAAWAVDALSEPGAAGEAFVLFG